MRGLRDQGVALIFVSHRYREVLEICDLVHGAAQRPRRRHGRPRRGHPRAPDRADARPAGGDHVPSRVAHRLAVARPVLARARPARRRPACAASTWTSGGARSWASAACSGRARTSSRGPCAVTPRTSAGEIRLLGLGQVAPATPRDAVEAGAGLITENRQDEGLFPSLSVARNISVARSAGLVWSSLVRVRPCGRWNGGWWARQPSRDRASRRASSRARS